MAPNGPKSPMPPWIRNLALFLAGLTAALALLHLLVRKADRLWQAKFWLGAEAAIPSWLAAGLLLAVGVCGFLLLRFELGRNDGPRRRRVFWLVFGAAFVLLSLDEASAIHEMLSIWIENDWQIVYGCGAAAFFLLLNFA